VDPLPDSLLLIKSGNAGNRTRDLWVSSQKPRGCRIPIEGHKVDFKVPSAVVTISLRTSRRYILEDVTYRKLLYGNLISYNASLNLSKDTHAVYNIILLEYRGTWYLRS
jgi:hypothetical protein